LQVRQAVKSSSRRRLEGNDENRAHPRVLVHFDGGVDRDEEATDTAEGETALERRA
jgi:hypothetical protein